MFSNALLHLFRMGIFSLIPCSSQHRYCTQDGVCTVAPTCYVHSIQDQLADAMQLEQTEQPTVAANVLAVIEQGQGILVHVHVCKFNLIIEIFTAELAGTGDDCELPNQGM